MYVFGSERGVSGAALGVGWLGSPFLVYPPWVGVLVGGLVSRLYSVTGNKRFFLSAFICRVFSGIIFNEGYICSGVT